MRLRLPWSRTERRQSATDAVITALVSRAGGNLVGDPTASGALEMAAGVWARSFAAATVTPAVPILSPTFLALVARNLARRGESVHMLDLQDGRLVALPVGSWDIRGDVDESTWRYQCHRQGPSRTRTQFVGSEGVLHFRYATDPARPWEGISPLGCRVQRPARDYPQDRMAHHATRGGHRALFPARPAADVRDVVDAGGRRPLGRVRLSRHDHGHAGVGLWPPSSRPYALRRGSAWAPGRSVGFPPIGQKQRKRTAMSVRERHHVGAKGLIRLQDAVARGIRNAWVGGSSPPCGTASSSRPFVLSLQPFVTPSIRPLKKSRWAKVKAMMPGATTTT